MTLRDFLKGSAVAGGLFALRPPAFAQPPTATVATSAATTGPFTLPDLSYGFDALEPHIDTLTMTIHHGKHHAAYIKNANAALEKLPEFAKLTIEELLIRLPDVPEASRTTLRNNAGGHHNHSLFWKILSPTPEKQPVGNLAGAISEKFGGLEQFKTEFNATAMKVFGSGWAWLSLNPKTGLLIESTPNQDSPLMHGNTPLLGLDVWEHAYYLKHQNRRADYVTAFWEVLDWKAVGEFYEKQAGA